jgi:lambda family phage tail tape measure protein
MTVDVSSLALAVDSTQVVSAATALDSMAKASSAAGTAQESFASGTKKGSDAAEQAARSAKSFLDSLERTAATLGMSRSALLEYDASLQKLDDTQKSVAQSAINQIAAFDSSKQSLDGLANAARGAGDPIGMLKGLFEGVGGGAGIAVTAIIAVVGAILDLAKGTADSVNQLRNLAAESGTNMTAMVAWKAIADEAGVSGELMARTLARLSNNMAEAEDESTKAAYVFNKLNVETKNLDGSFRDTSAVMLDLLTSISKIGSVSQQQSALSDAFGLRQALLLRPLLVDIEGNWTRISQIINDTGAGPSERLNQAALNYQKATTDTGLTWEGLKNTIFPPVIDQLTDMVKAMGGAALAAKDFATWIQSAFNPDVLKGLDKILTVANTGVLGFVLNAVAKYGQKPTDQSQAGQPDWGGIGSLNPHTVQGSQGDSADYAENYAKSRRDAAEADRILDELSKEVAEDIRAEEQAMMKAQQATALYTGEMIKLNQVINQAAGGGSMSLFEETENKINAALVAGVPLQQKQIDNMLHAAAVASDLTDERIKWLAIQNAQIASDDEEQKAIDSVNNVVDQSIKKFDEWSEKIQDNVDKFNQEVEDIGKSASQIKIDTEARRNDIELRKILTDLQDEENKINTTANQIRAQGDPDYAKFLANQIQEIENRKQIAATAVAQANATIAADVHAQDSFGAGWAKAFAAYNDGLTGAKVAQDLFNQTTQAFETLIVGVLNKTQNAWKTFTASILQMIEQMAAKMFVSGIFGGGGGPGLSSLFSGGIGSGSSSSGGLGNLGGLSSSLFSAGPWNAAGNLVTGNFLGGFGAAAGTTVGGTTAAVTTDVAGSAMAEMAGGASVAADASLAAGEGLMTFAGTIGAAIPVIGAFVAVALIAYQLLSQPKGGPKVGGYGAAGNFSNFEGLDTDNSRYYTPNQNDDQMVQLAKGNITSYNSALLGLGGNNLNNKASFAFGADTDPEGTAGNRVSAGAIVNGKNVYNQRNLDIGQGDVSAALGLEAQRALLAALQASDLPAGVAKILNSLAPKTATAEAITNAVAVASVYESILKLGVEIPATIQKMFDSIDLSAITSDQVAQVQAFSQAYLTISDILKKNPLAEAMKSIQTAAGGAYGALFTMGDSLATLGKKFDGSTAASQQLTQASVQYYQALIQELVVIQQMKTAINDTAEGFKRQITMQNMTNQQKDAYLQAQIAGERKQLDAATNPDDINRLTNQIFSDMSSAFNLETPEQQIANQATFLHDIDVINQEAQTKLDAASQKAVDASTTVINGIKTAMDAAAAKIIDSVKGPIPIDVNTTVTVNANGATATTEVDTAPNPNVGG